MPGRCRQPSASRRYNLDLQSASCILDLSPLRTDLWIGRIVEHSNPRRARNDLARKLKLLRRQAFHVRRYSRYIAGGPSLVCGEAESNRIAERTVFNAPEMREAIGRLERVIWKRLSRSVPAALTRE
jgi:hypothetical protein